MFFNCKYIPSIYILILVVQMSYSKVSDCSVEEHPSAVAIVNIAMRTSSCSGAIISPGHVVTVAHCMLLANDTNQLRVVAGVAKLGKQTVENGQIREINRVHFYLGSKDSPQFADIAVISVDKPFILEKAVYVIPIADNITELGGKCELVGWSLSSEGSSKASVFSSKSKQRITLIECPVPYGNLICGESDDAPSDCVGDTGSPLYFGGTLQGLLMGGACRSPGTFMSFMGVANYRDWLIGIARHNQSLWWKMYKSSSPSRRRAGSTAILWRSALLSAMTLYTDFVFYKLQ